MIRSEDSCPCCKVKEPPVLLLYHVGGAEVSYCRLCGCGFMDEQQRSNAAYLLGQSPLDVEEARKGPGHDDA